MRQRAPPRAALVRAWARPLLWTLAPPLFFVVGPFLSPLRAATTPRPPLVWDDIDSAPPQPLPRPNPFLSTDCSNPIDGSNSHGSDALYIRAFQTPFLTFCNSPFYVAPMPPPLTNPQRCHCFEQRSAHPSLPLPFPPLFYPALFSFLTSPPRRRSARSLTRCAAASSAAARQTCPSRPRCPSSLPPIPPLANHQKCCKPGRWPNSSSMHPTLSWPLFHRARLTFFAPPRHRAAVPPPPFSHCCAAASLSPLPRPPFLDPHTDLSSNFPPTAPLTL